MEADDVLTKEASESPTVGVPERGAARQDNRYCRETPGSERKRRGPFGERTRLS